MYIARYWIYLIVAILFGVLGTTSMKLSKGLKHVKPSVCLLIFYLISFAALTFAIKGMPMSMVYALWSGIGTLFVAIIGIVVFSESITLQKVISLTLIVSGVFGIYLTDAHF